MNFNTFRELLFRNVEEIAELNKIDERATAMMLMSEDAKFVSNFLTDFSDFKIKGVNEHEIYKNLMRNVDNDKVEDFFNDLFALPAKKSNILSERLRNEGNMQYLTQNYSEALKLYGKSLQLAEYSSETFVLTLGNRSAIFFHLKCYTDCLKDIDLCLNLNYPNHLKSKVFLRKIHCYKKLGLRDEMLTAITDFKTFLNHAPLGANEKNKMKILAGKLTRDGCDIPSTDIIYKLKLPEAPVFECHSEFPQVSSAIALRHTNEKGSYVVAVKDIKKGDVLFAEKSLVVAPTNPQQYEFYLTCCYCLTPIIQWIPCRQCTVQVYCDEECRNNDWSEYHKWECYGKRVNFWKSISEENAAFRILIKSLDSDLPHYLNKMAKIYMGKLKTMEGTLVKYFASSMLIVKYLEKYTDFFNHVQDKPKFMNLKASELKFKIGSDLLKCCALALFKAVDVSLPIITFISDSRRIHFGKYFRFAQGLYPLASNINHSCAPNATFFFIKDTIVIKANENISTKDEIFCSWFVNCQAVKTEERSILLLSKYNLKCECRACSDPEFPKFGAFQCVKCHGPSSASCFSYKGNVHKKFVCIRCKHEFSSHEMFKQELSVTKAFDVDEGSVEEICLNQIKALQRASLYQNLDILFSYMRLYALNLDKCNIKQAVKYLKQFADGFKTVLSNNDYLDTMLMCMQVFVHCIQFRHLFPQTRPVLKKIEEVIDEVEVYSNLVYPGNEHFECLKENFDKIVTICNLH